MRAPGPPASIHTDHSPTAPGSLLVPTTAGAVRDTGCSPCATERYRRRCSEEGRASSPPSSTVVQNIRCWDSHGRSTTPAEPHTQQEDECRSMALCFE